jgi:hypothetical protein
MDTETPNGLTRLLPDRHPQHDLFICDVADAALKDVMQQMEHPFYSLSKKPETASAAMSITATGLKSRRASRAWQRSTTRIF